MSHVLNILNKVEAELSNNIQYCKNLLADDPLKHVRIIRKQFQVLIDLGNKEAIDNFRKDNADSERKFIEEAIQRSELVELGGFDYINKLTSELDEVHKQIKNALPPETIAKKPKKPKKLKKIKRAKA